MLVGNVTGKVAVLIDDLADVSPLLSSLTLDCAYTRPRGASAPSLWRDESLRSADAWDSIVFGDGSDQCFVY